MIVPLTNNIYREFSGGPPPATVKGLALVKDGDVCAVCATTFIAGTNFIIFSVKTGFTKRDIIKGWAAFSKTLDDRKTYYAIIDRAIDTSHGLLNHFNFAYIGDDIYEYKG